MVIKTENGKQKFTNSSLGLEEVILGQFLHALMSGERLAQDYISGK